MFIGGLIGAAIHESALGYIASRYIYRYFRKKGKSYSTSLKITVPIFVWLTFMCIESVLEFVEEINDSPMGYILGIIVFGGCALGYLIKFAHDDKIRDEELALLPQRLRNYINAYGYTSKADFLAYCNTAPDFERSRKSKFINPNYERIQKENEGKSYKNKEHADEFIDFTTYVTYPYKEMILDDEKNFLRKLIPSVFMFDLDNLYDMSPQFHAFFDNEKLGKADFTNNARTVICEFIDKKMFRQIPKSQIFQSTLSPEKFAEVTDCECNMEEGMTIELSLDD